jgi:hypothetical protein
MNLSDDIESFREQLLIAYKEDAGHSLGAVMKMEGLFQEFIKELKYELGAVEGGLIGVWGANRIDKLAGDALCTKDEVKG